MSEFTVHTIPGSPFARSVMLALEEKQAPWRLVPVAPGAHKQLPHIARHPFGRVPVLEHDGLTLYETQAILRYIDRVVPNPPLTPESPIAAAAMDQVMGINDWYLFQGVAAVIGFQRIVGPRLMGITPDEAAIAAVMPKAHIVFNELNRLLEQRPYFAGDQLSLADLLVAPQIAFFAETPEWTVLTAANPNLLAWNDRMAARPSMQATTWNAVAAMARLAA